MRSFLKKQIKKSISMHQMLLFKILAFALLAMMARAEIMTITAYCNCKKCCGQWHQYKKTASGHTPKQGVTCAASRSIPFGTNLLIVGVGTRVVQDRLSLAYDNNRVDIFFNSHQEALAFGKQRLNVSIQTKVR